MSNYTVHEGACKFCGTPLKLRVHKDCPPTNIEVWKPNAACNPCADARRKMYQLVDKGTDLAAVWLANKPNANAELEQRIRSLFTTLTKAYCTACCQAFRVPSQWEPKLLNDLMQRPQNAYAILKDYEARFKPLVVQAEPPPELAPTLPEMDPF